MVKLFRRFQQPLMILITILVIVSFSWFYNRSDFMDRGAADRVGSIYGRNFTQAQFLREGRKYELSQALMPERWQSLIQPATNQDEAINNFVWNGVVLREEAERLDRGAWHPPARSEPAVPGSVATRSTGTGKSAAHGCRW